VDPAIDAAFPGRRAARVIVHVAGGRRFEFLQPTRKGDPDLPLTDEELVDKYRELASPVLGRARAEGLLDTLWSLETLESTRDLAPGARGARAATPTEVGR
jgi:2-methylcitrate dehydratase PrpD